MYHGIIQHKTFLTTYLRDQYLARGLDQPATGHGRIYRVRHKEGRLENVPDLDALSSTELVKLLAHKNGWHRDMAQRVLGTREGDQESIALLEKLASIISHPLAQIHALWTLEAMGKLTAAPVSAALNASEPKVVVSALWASTKLPHPEALKLEKQLLVLKPANDEIAIYLTRALGPVATNAAYLRINELIADVKGDLVEAAAISGLDHREVAFKEAVGNTLEGKQLVGWLEESSKTKTDSAGASLKGEDLASFDRGKALFHGEAACFGCHGPQGEGITGLGPPLDASEWVTGKPDVMAKILLHGLSGPITVAGTEYSTPADMPGLYQNPAFTDQKIADIMSYTRNEWSNKADLVKPQLIKELRAKTAKQSGRPYTAKDF